MFERFTDKARRTVVLAQENTRALGNNLITPAHILLGVLQDGENNGKEALLQASLTHADVKTIVESTYSIGYDIKGRVPFNQSGKKLLDVALREALQLGHNYIGPEHLVLAWIRIEDNDNLSTFRDKADAQILAKTGKTPQELRAMVIGVLSRYQPADDKKDSLAQIDSQEDFIIEFEIPNKLQEDFIYKNRGLISFLATSGKGSDINPSLSAIIAKLGKMPNKVSLQKSEVLGFCIWYGQTLSHLIPDGHPFQQLYNLFMSTLHPGLYG